MENKPTGEWPRGPSQRQTQSQRLDLTLYLDTRASQEWDERLETHMPLGQGYLLKKNLLNEEIYRKNEQLMNEFEVQGMKAILEDLGSPGGTIAHIGIGMGGDFGYCELAEELGFRVMAYDHSENALRNVPSYKVVDDAVRADILNVVENLLPDKPRSIVYVARVIHHLTDRQKVQRVLWNLGRFLKDPEKENRIVIVDPFLENGVKTKWLELPVITRTEDLKRALEQGASRTLDEVHHGKCVVYADLNPKTHVSLEYR
jgi:2-polyprenyl-3-methyl-5-hydroxy-6-metoxy-1,4-benzoquinol methylase